jgi:hypothetical protein
MEKFKKNQMDLEKITSDFQIEKSTAAKAEVISYLCLIKFLKSFL